MAKLAEAGIVPVTQAARPMLRIAVCIYEIASGGGSVRSIQREIRAL